MSVWFLPALCMAGLAANISGRTTEPLLTIIASDLSVSIGTAALLTSVYALPFALGQPLLGPLGDIYGKALILKRSLLALALSLLVAAFAPTLEILAAARFCAGLAAGGVVPACMATIGDAFPAEKRQQAISIFVTMGMLAQIFATSASGIAGEAYGWRSVLVGTALFAVIGVIAAWSVLISAAASKEVSFSFKLVIANYQTVFQNPKAVLCYSTVFLEGVGLYGLLPYVGAILQERSLGSATQTGIIIGALGVGGLIYVTLVTLLLKRWSRFQFMAAGGILMLPGPLALAFIGDWISITICFGITGLGFMLLHNSIQTEAVDLAPTARQSAYSLHALSFFTGQAVGPIWFGLWHSHFGYVLPILLSAAILLATGLTMARLFSHAK
jgi:predicted MFS family arabinose efflux permease